MLAVNNTALQWPMRKGGMDRDRIWGWTKVRHGSAAKLEPIRNLYREKTRLLKLKVYGSLVGFVDRFQGLEILKRKIERNTETCRN